ncbi:Man1-Src1p-C-terminal domain-containing protein [Flagelloscypha sp. PMI_526]|nr:Man1-Src1p-C-terminal domain-containing protein [Flagelloscypha sp. PMI_526]
MSRLTAADVIAKGDYLSPDFNPMSLTVSQLLGVLGHHDIKYPTPYNKPKLVQLFNNSIKAQLPKLLAERNPPEPSDDGIVDGMTGEPINTQKQAPPRRSSRKDSRPPSVIEDVAPSEPVESTKRRRTSAQPRSNSRTSSRRAPVEPVVVEDSDSEEDRPPRKAIRKPRKSDNPDSDVTPKRRISVAEGGGWDDTNDFQFGTEPTPVKPKPRRSSAGPRKSRKSEPLSDAPIPSTSAFPVDTRFSPQLSDDIRRENDIVSSRWAARESTPSGSRIHDEYFAPLNDVEDIEPDEEILEEEDGGDFDPDTSLGIDEDATHVAISKRLAGDEAPAVILPEKPASSFSFMNILVIILLFLAGHGVVEHKTRLAQIGYCNAGTATNTFLEELKANVALDEACRLEAKKNNDTEAADLCPPPDIFPFLHPMECIPCPPQATCTRHSLSCEKGFLLRTYNPFPITRHGSFDYNETLADDYVSKGKAALSNAWPYLRPSVGIRLCAGDVNPRPTIADDEGGEAKRWGFDISSLRKTMEGGLVRHDPSTISTKQFNQAIQQITSFGDVFIAEDKRGHRFIAHTTPRLTWDCKVTVWLRQLWEAWRATVIGLSFVVMTTLYGNYRRASGVKERKRIAELVQSTLQTLQDQEMAHHTDAVSNPVPYFVIAELRDFVLQDEHSAKKRQRLFDKVAKVVEQNANVRVSQEESANGDEVRVWRWVGSARRRSLAASSLIEELED